MTSDRAVIWQAYEVELTAVHDRRAPYWDVDVGVDFTSPSGVVRTLPAFWDGGRVWRVRVRPDEEGHWRWSSAASVDDAGLGRSGTFTCEPFHGINPLYRHGEVRVAPDGLSFQHADGTPFLWLGDTVWNGPMRSMETDWATYLEGRARQGFSVIQFFSTTWRALDTDETGHSSWAAGDRTSPDPAFYQRMDLRVEAINRHGLVASAIVVLALWDVDPGLSMSVSELIRFAGWLRARWGAYDVAWSLGGDGDFTGSRADRWKVIGPAVYAEARSPLVTMHPNGLGWCADEFRDDDWLTFWTYQSGHRGDEEANRFIVEGPATTEWREQARPTINVEPNYDDHPMHPHGERRFTDLDVRRASYWSVLTTPTAGVSYGHFSLWAWAGKPELVGDAIRRQEGERLEPWFTVLDTDGARSMSTLRRFLDSGPWWSLRPAADLLGEQPGDADVEAFQAVARSDSGQWLVAYLPAGGRIRLVRAATEGRSMRWFNPRSGHWYAAEPEPVGGRDGLGRGTTQTYATPSEGDWVLDGRSESLGTKNGGQDHG